MMVTGRAKRGGVIVRLMRALLGRSKRLRSVAREIAGGGENEGTPDRTSLRNRALAEATAAIIWRATPDGVSVEGEGWDAYCGAPVRTGQPDWWIDVIHPEDRERVSATWHSALRNGGSYHCEFRIRHVSGEYRRVADRGVPIRNANGTIEEWVGVLSDVHEHKQTQEAVQIREEHLRLALETTGTGIWYADLVTGHREWTTETRQILGLPADAPISRDSFLHCLHPDDRAEVIGTFFSDQRDHDLRYSGTYRVLRADTGEERWVAATGRTVLDAAGRPLRKIGTLQDITERKQSDEALRSSEERLRLALRAGRMVAWELDPATGWMLCSASSLEVLGIRSGPVSEFIERVHPEDRPQVEAFLRDTSRWASEVMEFRYVQPGERVVWLSIRAESPCPHRRLGITFDISDRKAAEEEAWRLSHHDPLTGLANRVLLQRRLQQALAHAARQASSVSLLLVDLDGFQEINDNLGYEAGDALLKEMATRLSAMVRDCDTVARFGGDQFMIMIIEPLVLHHATRFAEQVIEAVRQPFSFAGRTVSSQASIGVAVFPDHASDPTALIKHADFALRQAKAQGRERIDVYCPKLREATAQRVALGRAVLEAVSRDQFVPHYQPKVCLQTGKIVGFEALARWQHPIQGLLMPSYFGAAFNDPELARAIGRQLAAKVASDMRDWLAADLEIGRVAVNLSPSAFIEPGLADVLLDILDRRNVPTRHFEVEVTETVFLGRGSEHATAILEQLHEQGVQIALDDFGTGYASLTHLKQLPVDHLKIDQSFVQGLERDPNDTAIVAAVIGLARSLDLQVTAEGVETLGQVRRLRALGCNNAQGYYFGKPGPGSELPSLLAAWDAQAAIPEHPKK